MKFSNIVLPVSFLIIPLTFYSCGSDDDSSSTVAQSEEDTTGTTTGGSTGGGGGGSCMTNNQRANISNVLNRAADYNIFHGRAKGSFRRVDGSVLTSNDWEGDYFVSAISNSSWNVRADFCEGGDDCSFQNTYQATFVNGCLNWGGERARIKSTSSSQIIFSTPSGRSTDTVTISVSNTGFMRLSESFLDNGRKRYWSFRTDSGGEDDGGTDGGTVEGGSTDGGTTGGTTGGTDGGTSGGTPGII